VRARLPVRGYPETAGPATPHKTPPSDIGAGARIALGQVLDPRHVLRCPLADTAGSPSLRSHNHHPGHHPGHHPAPGAVC